MILVAPGTYHERIFIGPGLQGLTIQSAAGPQETVIDAQGMDRVVTIESNWQQIVIDGFTLRNGLTEWHGGGVGCFNSNFILRGNIIVQNTADDGDGIYFIGPTSVHCNDVWYHTGGAMYGDCTPSPDNFTADPRSCGPEFGDYTLGEDSPCLPGQSPAGCALIGAYGQGCGPVPLEPVTWGAIKATYR